MIALGIEGTAHTVGVGVVDEECNIIANVSRSYSPEEGGIHPREAANHHAEHTAPLIRRALDLAGASGDAPDIVAFSQGPGLGPCLRTVATGARALASSLDLPLVGVNHCVAHLEIGRAVTAATDPVLLYASGGNTQVISFLNGRYRVFGETLDIGVGNMLDKLGREMGMPFPAGPIIERKAREGTVMLDLPYSVKGMDVAFSGMLTAALNRYRKGAPVADVCRSVQETAYAMLTEVTERAMAHVEKEEVLLGGGVACNLRLREMVGTMAKERGADSHAPPKELCVDNGVMIAWTGLQMFLAGERLPVEDSVVRQRMRTDERPAPWVEG